MSNNSCNNCYFEKRLDCEDPCDVCVDPDWAEWKPINWIPPALSPQKALEKMVGIIKKIMS